jgi:glutamine synthetase type III
MSLHEIAREKGIKYFLISFVDLFGVSRAKLVPAAAIDEMQREGASFAGFAAWLDLTPADPDVLAIPDASSLMQLPWRKEVGWLAADLQMGGKEIEHAPRNILRRVIAAGNAAGYRLRHGVECEFFLIDANGTAISDNLDTQTKPCYDQASLMRRYDVISEICDYMLELGWGPYQNDHEDAIGQFEMNWQFDDALVTADRHAFFKFMVKSIAEKHGLRATFMPKPFEHLTGNGCHAHVSLWDTEGRRNLFEDPKGELGISTLGYHFLGGVLRHARALTAICNPTVNSYKRINAPVTRSGSTWSPNTVTYGGNNRTHMIRVPGPGRFELRLPDGAANPYLLPAAILAAGLDGIARKTDPGKRLDIDMYVEGSKVGDTERLPLNLLDALRALQENEVLRNAFGEGAIASLIKLRMAEWNEYSRSLTPWERANTLDV